MSETSPFPREILFPAADEVEEFPLLPIYPRADYARLPFHEGFDVPDVIRKAHARLGLPPEQVVYKVDFGSLIKPDANHGRIRELDTAAHHEANDSDGFLLYFRGFMDLEGYNRSFCMWRTAQEAAVAARKPAHQAAMDAVEEMYVWYEVNMHEMWLDADSPLGFDSRPIRHFSTDDQTHLAD